VPIRNSSADSIKAARGKAAAVSLIPFAIRPADLALPLVGLPLSSSQRKKAHFEPQEAIALKEDDDRQTN
jgi:hypothetical protein